MRGYRQSLVLACVGVHLGTTYGIMPEKTYGYEEMRENIREASVGNRGIKLVEMSNGLVVEVASDVLLEEIRKVDKKAITEEIEEAIRKRVEEETKKLVKYLKEELRRPIDGEYRDIPISIYSTTPKMVLNGYEYPTFKLTLTEVVGVLSKVKGLSIYLHNGGNFERKEEITEEEIAKGLDISSTGTGVFLIIRQARV